MPSNLVLFLFTAFFSGTPPQETGFLSRSVELDGVTYLYQVFVPSGWSPSQKWPVIFFLHGAGERGADGARQTKEGLPEILRREPKAHAP